MKNTFLKIMLLVAGLVMMPVAASAQSMSDSQVIEFVKTEQERGQSQQQIVSKLLQKGVTTEQLRRIRKKYEAEKSTLGASDLKGAGAGKSQSRMRQQRMEEGERYQKENNWNEKSCKNRSSTKSCNDVYESL